jgi:NAD(P)-dependent dehydrogenase (short-subunit alcohol dehydrogenase family)
MAPLSATPSDTPLEGRVALVTGAGRGIGRGIARALAALGACVFAVSRTEAELASLAAEIGCDYLAVSLADEAGCRRAVETAQERLGPVSVLVNNAGQGSSEDGRVWELQDAALRRILAVNLDAPVNLCRLVLPDMIAAGFGRHVVVASTAGLVPGPAMTGYVVSKHAAIGLARAVAMDAAAYGVTSNAVCPGWVRTEMAERKASVEAAARGITADDIWAERAASYPGGRVVSVEEVAASVAFLCTPAAGGVNGEAVTVALGSPW